MQTKRTGRAKYYTMMQNMALGRVTLLLALLLLGPLVMIVQAKGAEKQPLTAQKWTFPLASTQFRISDAYGERTDPFTGEEGVHRGIDLACAEGTPVQAAREGTVTAARRSTTYGNYLCILHPGGQETIYAHLQYLYVRAGEVVQAGQCIGTVGQTGRATGAHLHFELLEQGARIDPSGVLGLP